ncbi:SLC2A4 regulator [Orchesella cincta]|uniref:SLC2A4 regulator n=1 Tax=Orchesella cincta TaxID=48709 RepID=A0A1D2NBD0_ORCCI|nr:SLC2A4 regulator [Orchesella cincta]
MKIRSTLRRCCLLVGGHPPLANPEYKLNQVQQQRKSPNNTQLNPKKRLSPKSSPVRRPRGDTKKCRKVYGMDRRDLWCTQCKWKKACTRFGD